VEAIRRRERSAQWEEYFRDKSRPPKAAFFGVYGSNVETGHDSLAQLPVISAANESMILEKACRGLDPPWESVSEKIMRHQISRP
jgi:hypothetical protein